MRPRGIPVGAPNFEDRKPRTDTILDRFLTKIRTNLAMIHECPKIAT
jgi:hypothetical protein